MSLAREGVLFALGGVLGFVVDAGVVQWLVSAGHVNPYLARVPSFLLAATVTWAWNRRYTFAARRTLAAHREWSRWLGIMAVGAVINYGVYAALLATLPLIHAHPWLGVAAGSAAAALVNFWAARTVVFNG